MSNTRQIKLIRKLRTGTSYLTGHSPFIYKEPQKCPCCSKIIKEDNQHYIFECERFKNQRKRLTTAIRPILKFSRLSMNVETILGFPEKVKDTRKDEFNTVREVLWYQLGCYITGTDRFNKPKWIIPFLKSGIG